MFRTLRDLSVDAQVGLLFVSLFGLLLLVTLGAMLWSLRRQAETDRDETRRHQHDLRALWAAATLFWLAWVSGPIGATLLFAVLSFLTLREFITLQHTRRGDHRTLLVVFFLVLPMQYIIVARGHFDLLTVFIPVYVFFAVPVLSALAGDPHRFLERSAKIQFAVLVCVYGLSHAPALLMLEFPRYEGRGAFLVFFLVVVVGVAHYVMRLATRRFRGPAHAPDISSTFSFRAWYIAAGSAGVVGALMYWAMPFKAGQAFVLAAAAGAIGMLGEFVMEALKRDAGVVQWGNRPAITGAVGLLDRLAPLCFAAPVFFHGLRWYFNVGR
jgi:phosphatidate cytidylyltransferase